jgi:hypothetical protein
MAAITAPFRRQTVPRSGSSSPVKSPNKVVFPAPFRPTSASRAVS